MENLKILLSKRKKLGKQVDKSSDKWIRYRNRIHYRLMKVVSEAERFQNLSYQEMFDQFLDLLVSTEQLHNQGKNIMSESDLPQILKKILYDLSSYFSQHSIPYVIVGGIVVNILGRNRNTNDVNVVIDHTKLDINDFVEFLNKNDYDITVYEVETGFKDKSNITIYYESYRIDLVGLFRSSQITQIKHATKFKIFDLDLLIDSPETSIANKLSFGSLQDFEDALSVFIRIPIDLQKLELVARELKVSKFIPLLKKLKTKELSFEELDMILDELEDSM